jgi:hypothetical protein
MNKNNILFILDWDDTLFPTTWILQNNINIFKMTKLNQYAVQFLELDNTLYQLFYNLLLFGKIIIVTNASLDWISMSIRLIPRTYELIKNSVNIISARDKYHGTSNMTVWKKNVFSLDILPLTKNIKQIISIGDAEYEYNALINLIHDQKYKNIFLKSLRLIQNPNFDIIIDQINVITKSINIISRPNKYMDLIFTKF